MGEDNLKDYSKWMSFLIDEVAFFDNVTIQQMIADLSTEMLERYAKPKLESENENK
jgi:hypothetical protein